MMRLRGLRISSWVDGSGTSWVGRGVDDMSVVEAVAHVAFVATPHTEVSSTAVDLLDAISEIERGERSGRRVREEDHDFLWQKALAVLADGSISVDGTIQDQCRLLGALRSAVEQAMLHAWAGGVSFTVNINEEQREFVGAFLRPWNWTVSFKFVLREFLRRVPVGPGSLVAQVVEALRLEVANNTGLDGWTRRRDALAVLVEIIPKEVVGDSILAQGEAYVASWLDLLLSAKILVRTDSDAEFLLSHQLDRHPETAVLRFPLPQYGVPQWLHASCIRQLFCTGDVAPGILRLAHLPTARGLLASWDRNHMYFSFHKNHQLALQLLRAILSVVRRSCPPNQLQRLLTSERAAQLLSATYHEYVTEDGNEIYEDEIFTLPVLSLFPSEAIEPHIPKFSRVLTQIWADYAHKDSTIYAQALLRFLGEFSPPVVAGLMRGIIDHLNKAVDESGEQLTRHSCTRARNTRRAPEVTIEFLRGALLAHCGGARTKRGWFRAPHYYAEKRAPGVATLRYFLPYIQCLKKMGERQIVENSHRARADTLKAQLQNLVAEMGLVTQLVREASDFCKVDACSPVLSRASSSCACARMANTYSQDLRAVIDGCTSLEEAWESWEEVSAQGRKSGLRERGERRQGNDGVGGVPTLQVPVVV